MYISCLDQSQPLTNGITTVFEDNMGANGNSHRPEGGKMKCKLPGSDNVYQINVTTGWK